MQYTHLGRTGLQVSRFCLGTMNFGTQTTEPDSHAIMDQALERGINFFDTANGYGGKKWEGHTEQIIGRWLAQGDRRDNIVLATKCYGTMGPSVNHAKLSAYNIRRSCEASLKRLQTDHIDLYQMHHVDRSTPWEEILQAMELLVQQGKVLYVGTSNYAAWHITQLSERAAQRNFLGIVSEQSLYNLSNRAVELELLPACQALGIGVIPYSPINGGMLGGVLDGPAEGRRATERVQTEVEKRRPALEKWEAFCKTIGDQPVNVALAWLLAQPAVTAPIIGPRSIDQLIDCQRALDIVLTDEQLKELDEIWPGPGGQAPEAYAW